MNYGRTHTWIAAAGLALCLALSVHAMDVSMKIHPEALRVGESARCTITVRGADDPSPPQLPPMDGLRFSGPHIQRSSQITIINGRRTMDASVAYNYSIVPLKPGTYTIGPFIYTTGSQTGRLEQVKLQVVGADGTQPADTGDADDTDALFVKLDLPDRPLYPQESFDFDVALYTARGIETGGGMKLLNLPSSGLELQQFRDLGMNTEVINGTIYNVHRYRSTARALTAGTFELDLVARVNVLTRRDSSRRRRGLFDDPFFDGVFGGGVERHAVDVPIKKTPIEIRPFPAEGQPDSFAGAVGRFEFKIDVRPRKLTAGEPVTINMRIDGIGNVDNAEPPTFASIDGFKVYDAKVKERRYDRNRASGSKIFEQVVIPRSDDIEELPPLQFSFFNPQRDDYVTLRQGPVPLTVLPSTNRGGQVVSALPQSPVKNRLLGSDIVYLKPAPSKWRTPGTKPWYLQRTTGYLQLVPLLAVAGVFFAVRRRAVLDRDVARARRQRAPKSARTGLRAAQSALRTDDTAAFYEAVWQTLTDYFGHRLNLAPGEVTAGEVIPDMERRGLDEQDALQLKAIFETAEAARFGAVDTAAMKPEQVLQKLQHVMKACEKSKP